ncbi:helix-turn-helix domain-containing protein [Ralstonia pseudosolanacearum]|uniref:helix-turn-helix domain-containing protein n=1 Tax=Ralstonia pseudosolanacearum TaxID=1310165 RepID=UPI0007D7C295|nr:helix-turn-helix transcriptional regulator [Ralstonia pseudosolanacearum]MDC6293963.1 helix-turn-helix transcriptional regulator [Ralstonia pseudosolanacearum]MDD7788860.1 helix-turn-helix transcriptional regulator [Ralstonia pseudosolanacearum]MDN3370109.1 helix-turn-helix transcriptional regulator [Ralstonia pseudosolanacearum]OAK90918.1 hypothetical protein AB851_11745 [Ralstonia pseudosolanacearum]QOK87720.1 helix-turn-helix domain-containing protein [Ralstonia pseudosolanacearum]
MAALTPFGKEIRKLRIEQGETMMEMAQKLGKSPSFLSSIETGRKSVPEGLVEQMASVYSLSQQLRSALATAAAASANVFRIAPRTSKDQELVAAFARKIDSLSEDQRKQMFKILNG